MLGVIAAVEPITAHYSGTLLLVSIAIILGGLLMMRWSPGAGNATLVGVTWWAGFLLLILGLLLLLFPVLAFIYGMIRQAFGI